MKNMISSLICEVKKVFKDDNKQTLRDLVKERDEKAMRYINEKKRFISGGDYELLRNFASLNRSFMFEDIVKLKKDIN